MNYMQWQADYFLSIRSFKSVLACSKDMFHLFLFVQMSKMKGIKTEILEDLSTVVLNTFSCVYFSDSMSVNMARFKYPLHGGKYPTLVPFTVNEEGLRHLCKPLARELTVH